MRAQACISSDQVEKNILSAGVEATRLGHLVAELLLGAKLPDCGSDEEDDTAEHSCVLLPVGRLSVPTTGRRPNVLGVAGIMERRGQ